MEEEHENLLDRHYVIEEKVDQLEEQLEVCAEALEKIFMHLNYIDESVEGLRDHAINSQIMTVSASPPGWEPVVRGEPIK